MIVWLIAVVVIGVVAFVGYYQGIIRVAMSFVGLLISAALAVPLSFAARPVLKLLGVQHPLFQAALAPVLVFVVLMIIVKIVAHNVNYKINYHYEYKVSEGVRMRWDRFQPRAGLCLGLFNGTIYFLAIMLPFYIAGYLTTQISTGNESTTLRLVNNIRQQLHTTKIDKVLAGYDPAPASFYDASDVVGLLIKNPLLQNRLWRYPGFLGLAEKPEFQELANDRDIQNQWQSGISAGEFFSHPKVRAITGNIPLVTEIKNTLLPDLKDLRQFLETEKSAKYDGERILGRWQVDVDATLKLEQKGRPVLPLPEKKQLLAKLAPLRGAILICAPDKTVFLKRSDTVQLPEGQARVSQGTWTMKAGSYSITIDGNGAEVNIEEGTKLLLPRQNMTVVFDKETDR